MLMESHTVAGPCAALEHQRPVGPERQLLLAEPSTSRGGRS
jgi:hypothetical protein